MELTPEELRALKQVIEEWQHEGFQPFGSPLFKVVDQIEIKVLDELKNYFGDEP